MQLGYRLGTFQPQRPSSSEETVECILWNVYVYPTMECSAANLKECL